MFFSQSVIRQKYASVLHPAVNIPGQRPPCRPGPGQAAVLKAPGLFYNGSNKREGAARRPPDEMKYSWLMPGVEVRIWPGDTHAKYAVVREMDRRTVTFEITRVDPGEPFYRPGHRITLPWSHVNVRPG